MAKTPRRDDEPTRSRRVRAALAPLSRASVAATACILWVGLALPGLQLLPGAGGFGDKSIAISLQSALLGIDNGYAASPEVRAAMRALGLAVISESPVPRLRTDGAVSLAVDLAESIRTDAVDTTVAPTLVSDGPHNPPSAETDTPVGVPPLHERPSVPAGPSEPVAGGETQPTPPPTPPSAPTKSGQSITFSTSPSDAFVGGVYVVGASASSGLPVSFSLAPGSAGVCTISGATVSFVGPGTCTVRANQAGNASYLAAPQVTQSMDVDDAVAVQTISFLSTPPAGAQVGDPAYNVSAKASSGLPVEFGTEGESAGICKVTGEKVHLIGEGTCTINATQRGNSKFKPAPPVQQSFSIGTDAASQSRPDDQLHVGAAERRGHRRVDVHRDRRGELRPRRQLLVRQPLRVRRLGLDGLVPVAGDVHRAREPVGQRLLLGRSSGLAVVRRRRAADDHLHDGAERRVRRRPDVQRRRRRQLGLAVGSRPAAPPSAASPARRCRSSDPERASSARTRPGTRATGPPPRCSSRSPSSRRRSAQTITFTSSAPGSAVYLGPNYDVTATASSGLPVSFTVSGTCTLSGSSTVVMTGAGTCIVYANQSGSSAYLAAPQVQQTFAIAKGSQTITFPDPGNFDKNDPPFPLSATSTSGLAVTYTVDPSSASICSVSGNMVTPLGERGDCIVYANQAGDANYLAAPQVTKVIKIKNHTPG